MLRKLVVLGLMVVGIVGFGAVLSLGMMCGPIQRAVELAVSSSTSACPFR